MKNIHPRSGAGGYPFSRSQLSVCLCLELAQTQTNVENKSASKTSGSGKVVLYAAVGAELTQYDVDVDGAALVKRGSLTLPANVQEAAQHPSKRYLYVAWSNGGPSNLSPDSAAPSGSQHGLSAFRIDPASGALLPHGQPASLPSRPIHVTTDIPGTHVLAAYNDPSGVTVHRIEPDGTIGSQVKQPPTTGRGNLRASGTRRSFERNGDSHDARERPNSQQAGRPGRAEAIQLQRWGADESDFDCSWRRLQFSSSASGFSSFAAVGVCFAGAAKQARRFREIEGWDTEQGSFVFQGYFG